MTTAEGFDANEPIAGFSMIAIKRAITWVGVMDDRDDIKNVADALKCSRAQAERVLGELERRGLVARTSRKTQWTTTQLGHRLAFYWHPPRRFTPAIDRASATGVSEFCEEVPRAIWRSTPDDEEMFEEAAIDVGINPQYDGQRVIEINVTQPDEYQGETSGSGLTAISVYLRQALPRGARTGDRESRGRALAASRERCAPG